MAERSEWADERLHHLATRTDAGLDGPDRSMRELRAAVHALRRTILLVEGGMYIGFVSVLATIAVRT